MCWRDGEKSEDWEKGTYQKLVLVVVEGWNSRNTEFVNETVYSAIDTIRERTTENKMKGADDGTSLYLSETSDNTINTEQTNFKTILTGSLPGLIEIPKEMYFNNTEEGSNS